MTPGQREIRFFRHAREQRGDPFVGQPVAAEAATDEDDGAFQLGP